MSKAQRRESSCLGILKEFERESERERDRDRERRTERVRERKREKSLIARKVLRRGPALPTEVSSNWPTFDFPPQPDRNRKQRNSGLNEDPRGLGFGFVFPHFFREKNYERKNPESNRRFFLLLLQDKVCLMPELIICTPLPLPLLPQLLLLRRGPRIPRNNG